MFKRLTITFHLDGSGVSYDTAEPIMLDGLLAAACTRHHVHGEAPARDETPDDIPLPLQRWHSGDTWGWCASALFPDGRSAESLLRWRKRFRQDRIALTEGSPNLTNGIYREWDMPVPVLLVRTMVSYACGDAYEVRRALKRSIRWIGKKRAHGRGKVLSVDVVATEGPDWSCTRDGIAMRYLPSITGSRLVRPRPPYWSSVGRVRCCEIGAVVAEDAGPPSGHTT